MHSVQCFLGKECSISVQLASAYGKLGNIDANTGDAQTGWDTDQFLTDPKEALLVAATILKQGGLAPGETLKLTSPCFLRSTHEYLLLPQAAGLLCQMSQTQTLELATHAAKTSTWLELSRNQSTANAH